MLSNMAMQDYTKAITWSNIPQLSWLLPNGRWERFLRCLGGQSYTWYGLDGVHFSQFWHEPVRKMLGIEY